MKSRSLILAITVFLLPLTTCSSSQNSIYTIAAKSCLHEDTAYTPRISEQVRSTFRIGFNEPSYNRAIHSPTLKKKKKVTFDDNVVIRRIKQQRQKADNRDTTKLEQIRNVYTQPRAMNVRSSNDGPTTSGTTGSSSLPEMKLERPKSVMQVQERRRPPTTVPPVTAARSKESKPKELFKRLDYHLNSYYQERSNAIKFVNPSDSKHYFGSNI